MFRDILFKKSTPRWIILLIDLLIVFCSIVIAYELRFNFSVPDSEFPLLKYSFPTILGIRLIAFLIGKPYSNIVRYTSVDDARKILRNTIIGSVFIALSNGLSYLLAGIFIIPFSIVIIEFLITSFIMILSRGFIMIIHERYKSTAVSKSPVLIFGAGEAGIIAKRTIDRDANSPFEVIGFIDDDKMKIKRKLENKSIYAANKLEELIERFAISHLIISTQNLNKDYLQRIIKTCLDHRVQVLNVPSASKWINGELSVKQIRQIKIEDLLGRAEISLSRKKIESQLKDKTVMITGAAGSIGSEIVRQIINYAPKKVLLVDQAESALYELEMELSSTSIAKCTEIIVGDICNAIRMRKIFDQRRPEIVYHAAAYKHVPMMENNPSEAVLTNIKGTKIIADLADEYKIETFIMISTDKAVNPTNVMGATKRVAEIYTQSLNAKSTTNFITSRFGNVLGSNGSVIPLFKKQIENGGPITVTHPEITRYFMTIPEACQLVLEAGAAGKGGEIFLFDMGESIKIKNLASQMIKLSGLEEGKDIQIVYSGLRPGEKLYEELLNDAENTKPTHHSQIMIADLIAYNYDTILPMVETLIEEIENPNNHEIVLHLKKLVPEYKSNNSEFEVLDKK